MKIIFMKTSFLYRKHLLMGLVRTVIFLCFTTVFSLTTYDMFSQNSKITLEENKTLTVDEVFKLIMDQTDYKFFYEKGIFKDLPTVELKKGVIKTNALLKKSLVQGNLDISVTANNAVIIQETKPVKSFQGILISGIVLDHNDVPLPGANILEKGTSNGTQTDFDGKFNLTVQNTDAVLIVSYLGYLRQEVSVHNRSNITVTLREDAAKLDEVVLIGYGGTQRKSDLTGAITQVSTRDFEKQPVIRFDQVLQGRTSGIQVLQSSGAPGNAFKIRIRGANSVSGNNDPLYVVDGIIDVNISTVNPNDIASINVLKDASATAIYGNQGANGVVIITTKKGSEGSSSLEYNTFWSIESLREKVDVLNASDFAKLVNQRAPGTYTSTEIENLRTNGGTDWQDEVFKSGFTQNHQLAFSGGKDKFNYYLSGNIVDQEGIVINSGYERLGIRTTLNGEVTDKLNLSFSMNASREERLNTGDRANTPGDVDSNDLVIQGALLWDPTSPVRDANGNLIDLSTRGSIKENPVAAGQRTNRNQFTNTFQGNLALNYAISDDLTFNVSMGSQLEDINDRNFRRAVGNLPTQGFISDSQNISWQVINRLSYKKTFNEVHGFSIDFVYETRRKTNRFSSILASGFDTEAGGVDNIALGKNQVTTSSFAERKLRSYFARTNYDYKERYLFSASLRVDQSSVFPNHRNGYFPAFSAGWNISNEEFMNSQELFSNLKLRGSWGITGNQSIAPFSTLAVLSVGGSSNFSFDGSSISVGVGPSNVLANPDLKWEETTQINIGVDATLWENRLSFSADYYAKETEGLLLERSLPAYTGVDRQLVNSGVVQNEGFELNLNLRPLAYDADLSWDLGFNLSSNRSEVISLLDGQDEIIPTTFFGAGAAEQIPFTSIQVGEPLGNFRGFDNIGIWQTSEAAEAAKFGAAPGDWKFRDVNGDGVIDSNDVTVVGNGTPDFVWGINNTFSYKNFDLNIFIQSSVGNDVYNLIRSASFGQTSDVRHATSPELLNAWTTENPSNTLPRLDSPSKLLNSFFVEDGSFVRLKNISLGYNFPDSILNRYRLSSARVYMSGQNLVTISDYKGFDPEVSSGDNSDLFTGVDFSPYPIPKAIIFGLSLAL